MSGYKYQIHKDLKAYHKYLRIQVFLPEIFLLHLMVEQTELITSSQWPVKHLTNAVLPVSTFITMNTVNTVEQFFLQKNFAHPICLLTSLPD